MQISSEVGCGFFSTEALSYFRSKQKLPGGSAATLLTVLVQKKERNHRRIIEL